MSELSDALQHATQSLPASTIDAARVKRCRINFCTPVTSGLNERECWTVQQGSCTKFLATLPDLIKYVEELAPWEPMVLKRVNFNVENPDSNELQEAAHE